MVAEITSRARRSDTLVQIAMNEFSILPWEYRGSGHSTAPGAQTESEIGGRKRQFTLKMREGVIFFKEPERAPMWAVTRIFERDLKGEELVEAWRREMANENYGRFVVYRPQLGDPAGRYGAGVRATLALVQRADYSGWAREWFDSTWLDVPAHRDGKKLDLWEDRFQAASLRALYHTRDALLDRDLPAAVRRDIEPHWVAGDEAGLQRVFALAVRLFARDETDVPVDPGPQWSFAAANPVEPGGWSVVAPVAYYYNSELRFSTVWEPLLKLLERHFVWVGMNWKQNELSGFPDIIETPTGTRIVGELVHKSDDWRGQWQVETPFITLNARPVATLSAHDKLEATLELRDWLQGKISPRQCANWLSKSLD